jgi:hypothetical protein
VSRAWDFFGHKKFLSADLEEHKMLPLALGLMAVLMLYA